MSQLNSLNILMSGKVKNPGHRATTRYQVPGIRYQVSVEVRYQVPGTGYQKKQQGKQVSVGKVLGIRYQVSGEKAKRQGKQVSG